VAACSAAGARGRGSPTKKALTLAEAKKLAAAAEEEAVKDT